VAVYELNPLTDARWARFLAGHPGASVFHTPEWLEALKRTYGYEPVAYTTSPPGEELSDGLVFCRIESWLTGCRLVSLPFTDHCQPLADRPENLQALLAALREEQGRAKWKYVELRPLTSNAHLEEPASFGKSAEFYFHTLDLRPHLDSLYRNFHDTSIRQRIRRAEREQLVYEEGRSEPILTKFYHLLLLTRRRHQLPPQPLSWFRNLIDCLNDKARIHVVSKDGHPIASILTLFFKDTLVYKYGCSDGRFHNLGGMSLLLWKAIQEGKELGAQEFDLGRSETDNPGLVAFKGHLGAACRTLNYYRYPPRMSANSASGWKMRIVRNAVGWLPDSLLTAAGRLLYKHVG